MAVFLANEDVEQLISMRDCIDSVEPINGHDSNKIRGL
jgi:hypothetical protein